MSWKATGFVKSLRAGLSVTDKFVMLILADYHQPEERSAWPSLSTLAKDCLMTERGVQQILSRLEANGFIAKRPGCGRGNVSGYQFVGLDDIEKDEQQTTIRRSSFNQKRTHSDAVKDEQSTHSHVEKDAQPASAIRKEPLEPRAIRSLTAMPIFDEVMPPSKSRPSLEEVKIYCRERRNSVDPEKWFDHYSANGWRVGRNPMRDWKAAVRTWERNGFQSPVNGKPKPIDCSDDDSPAAKIRRQQAEYEKRRVRA
jgi:hypothetical protein